MPKLAEHNVCTGCSACSNACLKHAVEMKPVGRLGHLYPVVDEEICVDCKACERACPVLNLVPLQKAPYAIAAWAKSPEENKASTSGGVATAMARSILKSGGIVYGCANQGVEVQHVRIDDESDLELLRGSKYVQSTIGLVFQQVKQDLKIGKRVLFIGTPCQNAGLRAYLRDVNENLILVDIVCHGVPSLKLLQEHIKKITPLNKVKKFRFRDGIGGVFGLFLFNYSDDLIYQSDYWRNHYDDSYYCLFMQGYTYRPSCNTCRYAQGQRCSDLTIGDFWGLGKESDFIPVAPAFGYSVVLPNTEHGLKFLDNLHDLLYMQERSLSEAVNGNAQLKGPKKLSFKAKIFQYLFEKGINMKTALYVVDFPKVIWHKYFRKWLVK